MASGLFFGGLAQGFQRQEALNNQQNYEQGLLQLQQQRLQQDQQRQQRAEFMQLRSQAIQDMQNTVTAVKNAHQDWTDLQVASFPAIVAQKNMLAGFDKNLGLPDTADSIVAGLVTGKSEIQTAQAKAQATGELGLRQSEIAKNQAQTKVLSQSVTSPDSTSDNGPTLLKNLSARSGMTEEELDVMGRARAAGNSGVLQNLGRGKQGGEAVKAVNAWAIHSLMQDENLTAAEAAAKLNENTLQFGANKAGTTAGARTASTRAANLGIILDTAGSAVDAAVAASDALPRGQFVPANQAIQAAQKAGSNPELKVFAQKNLQLAELWAKSMNPTGTMRESDRELALSVLSTADSPETYRAAANAIKASIGLEKGAAIKFLKDRGLSPGAEKSDSGITVHGFTFTPSQ